MDDIIDLTDSFCLVPHRSLQNIIIELDTDESFNESLIICDTYSSSQKNGTRKTISSLNKTDKNHHLSGQQIKDDDNTSKSYLPSRWGDCPICWDALGQNPLASTKCGHVFCMKCLEISLKVEKKCPTCRSVLKGSSAYHPLYLN